VWEKTEVAKVLAELLHTNGAITMLRRLDEARAYLSGNYQKPIAAFQADAASMHGWEDVSSHVFSRDYLLERPLLQASAPRVEWCCSLTR